MIEIINKEGYVLELYDNFSLTVERENPLFQKNDEFFQDITYPGKAPLTPSNKLFIKSGQLVEASIYNYETEVNVLVDGSNLFSGTIAYSIEKDEISFVLKTAYAAISKFAETKLLQFIDYGPDISNVWANKNDSLIYPGNWPFAYFPTFHNTVKEEEYYELGEKVQYYSNPYDYANQEKYRWKESDPYPKKEIAHWKLVFILEKVLQEMGFVATGTFFTSPKTVEIYIYNLQIADEAVSTVEKTNAVKGVPHITIAEFLKLLKARFRINIIFDMLQKTARVDEPNELLNSTEFINISANVSSIEKISIADHISYTINAKLDDYEFNPPNHITVNNPKLIDFAINETIELNICTLPLKKHNDHDYNDLLTKKAFIIGRPIGPYPIPGEGERIWRPFPDSSRLETLQLVRYLGLGLVTLLPEKYYPLVKPVSFTIEDGEWFAFLNDSKQITLKAFIPSHILSNLNVNKKIGFTSREGFFTTGIAKKISYTLYPSSRELVEVEIELFTLIEKRSKVKLVDNELTNERPPREPRK